MKMNEMLLGTESYYNEYLFLKTLRFKLEKGEVYIEQITSYISNSYKKLDGGEIMYLMDIFRQLEHIFTVHLEEWEKNNNTKFNGFVDIEQYLTLSQRTISDLGDLLQNKLNDLIK